jgi:hypothetical protein
MMRDQIWQIRRVLRITSENICAFAKEKKKNFEGHRGPRRAKDQATGDGRAAAP